MCVCIVCMYVCVCMYVYVFACVCVQVYTSILRYNPPKCNCIDINNVFFRCCFLFVVEICLCICLHVCMYVCMYVRRIFIKDEFFVCGEFLIVIFEVKNIKMKLINIYFLNRKFLWRKSK